MDQFELELKAGFLEEAAQLLSEAEQCFLNLEIAQNDPSIIEKIFRLAHNLKGSAKAVGFSDMGEFTHQLESLLLKVKNKEIQLNTPTINLLLQCNDFLNNWVQTLKGNADAKVDASALAEQIKHRLENPGADADIAPASEPASVADVPPAEAFEETSEVQSQAFAELAPIVQQSVQQVVQAPTDENIRVSLGKLEKLINNVGELVILQTVLNQQRHQIASPLIQKTIAQLAKITKDIQGISMSLRMVPLKTTFQKMQRIVRDTSKALNKDVFLEMHGEETELDKTIVDHLGDPLVHMIRNAVDHGLETTEERVAAGKPAKGHVTLAAFHQGGQMVIEITDDGRGLDANKLRQKATEKGILKPGQQITDQEAYYLIFAPGFSTKTEVTDISGRGVGMDVVKTNIEQVLQGEVQLSTELGKGTRFKVLLPLTLAIIDGMVVRCGDHRFVIPLNHVFETLKPEPKDVHFNTGTGEMLSLRGEYLPLYPLSPALGIKTDVRPANESIAIVIRTGDTPFAFLVDDIIGQQQVVIKQLGNEIKNLKGITGGAILGDGRAALILDLNELVQHRTGKMQNRPRTMTANERGVA